VVVVAVVVVVQVVQVVLVVLAAVAVVLALLLLLLLLLVVVVEMLQMLVLVPSLVLLLHGAPPDHRSWLPFYVFSAPLSATAAAQARPAVLGKRQSAPAFSTAPPCARVAAETSE
jgi:hypothetical protein